MKMLKGQNPKGSIFLGGEVEKHNIIICRLCFDEIAKR